MCVSVSVCVSVCEYSCLSYPTQCVRHLRPVRLYQRYFSTLYYKRHSFRKTVTEHIIIIIIIIIIIKEAEKILKYKDLAIEIQRMLNVKTKVIPAIIGANGTISKLFRKYVSKIPGTHEVKEIRKTAILGTAHILQKVLM